MLQQAKEKYEKALDELSKCTPQYMENMEQVFDQCQQFEEKRLNFLREVLLDVKRHLNLTEDQRFETFKTVNMTRLQSSANHDPNTKNTVFSQLCCSVQRT